MVFEKIKLNACRLIAIFFIVGCSDEGSLTVAPSFTQSELLPGGAMTAKRSSDRTYVIAGAGLDSQQKLAFWTGFSLFRDPWVIAPSSTTDRDGLGPLFNTRSCISCHLAGGRGPAPTLGESKPSAMVIRLGLKDNALPNEAFEKTQTFMHYGGQIQPRAISITHSTLPASVQPEAKLKLSYEVITGYYADGSEYQLVKPSYDLTSLAYGPLEQNVDLSPRFAPIVYGVGLLDAITEHDLLAQEDPDDIDNDGISARYNRVIDIKQKDKLSAIGRFGLKAKHPTLRQQVAAAFRDDIGITNSWFPSETCTQNQPDCVTASNLGGHNDVEIPDKLLQLVVDFNQYIAVPPARNLQTVNAQKGRNLFYQSGCHSCHTPSYVTDPNHPVTAMANQHIWPYTDLALHDMGPGLADGVREFEANGNEWRTPPLWGLGAQKSFRKDPLFLHDGRARTIEEAILWHGGEGQQSRDYFIQLNEKQRRQLLAFLDAI